MYRSRSGESLKDKAFITNQLFHSFLWVVRVYYGSILYPSLKSDLNRVLKRIKIWYDTRGPVWTADAVKLHRLSLTRYLAGQPLPRPSGISLTRDGLSRLIPHQLRENIRAGDPRSISLALTLLSVTRMISGGKPVDTAAIEETSNPDMSKIIPYIDQFLDHYGIEKIDTTWSSFHWSTKMGPSGPALVSALGSWRFIPEELKTDMVTIGGQRIADLFNSYKDWPTVLWDALIGLFPCRVPTRFRKLSVKADREAKSRVFAMLDYYSQSVLVPIHKGLFQGLERIPSDRTFVQAEGLTFDPSSDCYHSLDLSSATDRFPMILQKEVISRLIGPEKAAAWARILTKYPYDLNGRPVLYGTGQPMGAYSSWSAFTMTHHLVVFVAARLAGKPVNWSNYALLGDDIVIADNAVAKEYRRLLQDLQVPVSEQKTHTSKDVFEFAKRWFYKGQEVTPFPLHGLMETAGKYHLLLELLRSVKKRGFGESAFSIGDPGRIPSLLRIFGFRHREIGSFIKKFLITACLPLKGASDDEVYNCALHFCRLAGLTLSCNLKQKTVVRLFERFAVSAVTWTLARESERILTRVTQWHDAMMVAIDSISEGPADQTEFLNQQGKVVPVIGALGQKSEAALKSVGPDEVTGAFGNDIWDTMSRLKLINIPEVSGINPIRSSYQIAGARATWALNLARLWKRHEQGLRPGR